MYVNFYAYTYTTHTCTHTYEQCLNVITYTPFDHCCSPQIGRPIQYILVRIHIHNAHVHTHIRWHKIARAMCLIHDIHTYIHTYIRVDVNHIHTI